MRALLLLLTLSSTAHALVVGGFEDAKPLDPLWIEVGGGALIGQGNGAQIVTSLGLTRRVEVTARLGVMSFDEGGDAAVEFEGGALLQILTKAETGAVDLSALLLGSALRTEEIAYLSLDPSLLASHYVRLDKARRLSFTGGVGLAFSLEDKDGGHDARRLGGVDLRAGAGVDVIPALTLHLQGRLRDESWRLGVGLTYTL